jgi:hypothetical protein
MSSSSTYLDEEDVDTERDDRCQNELAVNRDFQTRRAQALPPPSSWLPNNVSLPSSYASHGFNASSVSLNQSSIPSFYELAMYQQKLAVEQQQSRLQMMHQQAALSQRRKTPRDMMEPSQHEIAQMAMQRLRKKRRAARSNLAVANLRGSGSYPMPRLDGYRSPEISLPVFQQTYENLHDRASLKFPNSADMQKEYVKWRFAPYLSGSRIPKKLSAARRKVGAP